MDALTGEGGTFPKSGRDGRVRVRDGVHGGERVGVVKLTREWGGCYWMQDSLGGNSKTTIIATVSPSSWLVPMYRVVDS